MNLWKNLRRLFGAEPPAPPQLRNKPGGLAWIRGQLELHGAVVTCEAADARGMWSVLPRQHFIAERQLTMLGGGTANPGDAVTLVRIHDSHLEPIRGIGDEERSQEADFQPKVPTRSVYDAEKHAASYPGY